MAAIRIYGDPILRKTAEDVTEFDDDLREFVERMKDDMVAYDGVGLAAPQVGRSLRIVVIDITAGEREPLVLINPKVIWSDEERVDDEEGCLSIPDIRMKVSRPKSVTIEAFDENGEKFQIENAEGLLARALQHEFDHLDGILFVDRASLVARRLISGKLKKLARSRREKSSAVYQ